MAGKQNVKGTWLAGETYGVHCPSNRFTFVHVDRPAHTVFGMEQKRFRSEAQDLPWVANLPPDLHGGSGLKLGIRLLNSKHRSSLHFCFFSFSLHPKDRGLLPTNFISGVALEGSEASTLQNKQRQ